MTKVEECTKAEIGVGAAIAIGNQGEKGYNALLVIKVSTIKDETKIVLIFELNVLKSG